MAIAGRLAKGALDALGGKKYTGKKTTGQKAYGGKVMKRMGGGNTMYRKYGGSVGEQMVAACYKDKGVS